MRRDSNCQITSLLCAVCLTVLLGCERSYSSSVRQPSSDEPKKAARTVKAVRVTSSPQERLVQATGSLAAHDRATLSTKVSGRLQSIAVDVGDLVREGDLLAQIERRDYELRVRQAEALLVQARARLGLPLDGTDDRIELEKTSPVRQSRAVLEEARANKDRITRLSKEGIISQSELDTAAAAFEVALSRHEDAVEDVRMRQALVVQRRAEVELARQQLTDSAIRAPFDGAIEERRANLGEYLAASTPVVSLVRMDPLRLRLEVPERDASGIKVGQKVRLTVEGNTNTYHGEIKRLSPVIEEQSLILRVEADVPNPGSLRPGSFVRADIIVDEKSRAILLPVQTVITFAGLEKVFVVEGGKAVEKQVLTGRRRSETGPVEIVTGLQVGDLVILNPGNLLSGETVAVANQE